MAWHHSVCVCVCTFYIYNAFRKLGGSKSLQRWGVGDPQKFRAMEIPSEPFPQICAPKNKTVLNCNEEKNINWVCLQKEAVTEEMNGSVCFWWIQGDATQPIKTLPSSRSLLLFYCPQHPMEHVFTMATRVISAIRTRKTYSGLLKQPPSLLLLTRGWWWWWWWWSREGAGGGAVM